MADYKLKLKRTNLIVLKSRWRYKNFFTSLLKKHRREKGNRIINSNKARNI